MEPFELSYFESYANYDVHKLMLKDKPRIQAYKDAILSNKSEFKDKVVLDVGAGTGILSVFCAQAGAGRVYAVEASDIYRVAEQVVKENHYEEVIKVINGAVEDIVLPARVDIIVSEWMGFYLFHEAMLESVILAREMFLKPDGLMFPESAALYSVPCSVPSIFEEWGDVEGVSMQSFGDKLKENASKRPITEIVQPESLLCDPEVVIWLDLREITLDDLKTIEMRHVAVAHKRGTYQGICLWFSCTFPSFLTEPVILSTDPEDPCTHWKQTVIVLPTTIEVDKGTPIAYDLILTKSEESSRKYMLEVTMLDPEEVEHPEYCPCHLTKCILVRAMLDKYEKDCLPDTSDK